MISEIKPLNGQSNWDLCLQAIGGFDSFINFLSGNGLNLSSVPSSSSIEFDTNNIKSKVISGNVYSTYSYKQTLQPILNNDGTPLLDNNGQPIYNN